MTDGRSKIQFLKIKWPPVSADAACEPAHWSRVAQQLLASAAALWPSIVEKRFSETAPPVTGRPDHRGAFMLLAGYAVENALKGRILSNWIADGKLFRTGAEVMAVLPTHHDLPAMASAAEFALEKTDRDLLVRLREYVVWAGRYPVWNMKSGRRKKQAPNPTAKAQGSAAFRQTLTARDLRRTQRMIGRIETAPRKKKK
jgi:hypothetical protein